MSDISNSGKPEDKSSTTSSAPKLRLNREKVKVFTVRTSLQTGRGCAGSCKAETSID